MQLQMHVYPRVFSISQIQTGAHGIWKQKVGTGDPLGSGLQLLELVGAKLSQALQLLLLELPVHPFAVAAHALDAHAPFGPRPKPFPPPPS